MVRRNRSWLRRNHQNSKKGKSCDFVKDIMDDYEVNTIAELEAAFEIERDEYLDEAGCNDTN